MNCREWEEAIALYAAGDLEARRRLEVEQHLGACPGCQIFAGGMRECLEAMREAHRQEIGEASYAAVRARVLAKLQPAPWWRRRWVQASALAALACGALWLALVDWQIRRPVAPPAVTMARPAAPPIEAPVLVARARPLPRRRSHPPRTPKPKPAEEPLTVRMVTDNPDVVIYWITDPKENK